MIKARRLLEQISARKFPRAIAKLDYLKPQKREFEDEVKRALNEAGIDCTEITIVMKVFHFGKGFHNPIGDVLFYETKNSVELVKYSTDTSCSRTCLFVYGPVGCSDEFASKIHQHLSNFAADKGFEIPTKLFP
uniref:Uncharacterized protein n=1 Tax=Panagrolaimus sp. PS1159 TaxID=55785 RepID=A0AC35G953_9BILA